MNTVEVNNPKVMEVPAFREMVLRSLDPSPWGPEAIDEISKLIVDPNAQIVVSMENAAFVGISVALLPVSPLDNHPQVIHIYNEGSIGARRVLVKATAAGIKDKGYDNFWAINFTGRRDEVWTRAFKPEGWEVKPIGSIMEFKVNG